MRKRTVVVFVLWVLGLITLGWMSVQSRAVSSNASIQPERKKAYENVQQMRKQQVTQAQREAAAKARLTTTNQVKQKDLLAVTAASGVATWPPGPLDTPDYFGMGNWAYSPLRGAIYDVAIADPGSGYLAPVVAITDATGSGATATATVVNGAITAITLTNPGSGYTAPSVTITDPTGLGTGASATATADAITGAITAITLTSRGGGYPTLNVAITDPTGQGTGASAIATADAKGAITAVKLTNPGGCFTAPLFTITNPAGSGATAAATAAGGVITDITLFEEGQNYIAPVVSITDPTGTGATATATAVGGVITAITLISGGQNYSAPEISITDSTNVGAAAVITASVEPGIRKFVDTLPKLGAGNPNNLGQYIPVAVPDKTTYPGSDYYEIAVVEYIEKLHSDLPPTRLRGYVQLNDPANPATRDPLTGKITAWPRPHYLGPTIVAQRDVPVRVKFTNLLPTGMAGDLFIPVDTTVMGAGMGPKMMDVSPGAPMNYTQNRATVHLHGGRTPWISDGTPHQWITPAGENTDYPKGVSVKNVPDMPDPGDGSQTFFYSNQQSARLLFYHDHVYGITRLNVYAGEAAGYLISDPVEQELVSKGLIPADQIPLIIQDKSFVDANTVRVTDPTWNWGTGTPDAAGIRPPVTGDLWLPHVYMTAQNPFDLSGANPFGRWHYGPWFWPPTAITHGPVPNPYYGISFQPPEIPGVPHPSMGMESFFDTSLVNGTAYPTLTVDPRAYRFRVLNAANDRFWNLQLYEADPSIITADGRINTEVRMVPAVPNAPYLLTNPNWPTDGRAGGVPDPAMAGPAWIQIGTEGGFLPAPAVIPTQPIAWNMDPTTFNFGNVSDHSLLLGPAERADVIVDFSKYAGKTLIVYNDAPTAFPALDPRYDYYTGHPDMTETGGAPPTLPGYGPNTRTIMQIKVSAVAAAGVPVASVSLNSGGSGYTQPSVAITGGGGTGADATVTGSVDAITVTNGGSGYTNPTVTLSDGGGTGATAEAVVDPATGAITAINVLNGGSGYPSAPAVSITDANGGTGAGATASATLKITGITLNSGGSGYTSAPAVAITDSNGTGAGATATASLIPPSAFNQAPLVAAFKSSRSAVTGVFTPGAFARSQDPIIVGQADPAYESAYSTKFPTAWPAWGYVRIQDTSMSFKTVDGSTINNIPMQPKGMHDEMGAAFDPEYGRMSGKLGVELPFTNATVQNFILYSYIDLPTENVNDSMVPMAPVAADGTQIWKITHNGVDTHPIHFHLFDVQLINRVGWDGAIRRPDPNELGWKDTLRISPLEDTIVALRPVAPRQPFGLPDSIRPLDPTMPLGSTMGFTNLDPLTGDPITPVITNKLFNFGWEYMWHCHILSHEEMEMMRPISFNVARQLPAIPVVTYSWDLTNGGLKLTWTDGTPLGDPAIWGNPANEVGFRIVRAPVAGNGKVGQYVPIAAPLANQSVYTDMTALPTTTYSYRIAAYNAAGDTTSTAILVGPAGVTPPAAPSALTATLQAGPQVSLTWRDNAANETGFVVERAVAGILNFIPVGAPPARSNTGNVIYVDATVQPGTDYVYRVKAVNGGGASADANFPIVSVPPVPAAPTGLNGIPSLVNNKGAVMVGWTDASNNETGFTIQRATNVTFTANLNSVNVGANVNSLLQTGLARGTTYYYRVRAYNLGGPSTWAGPISVTTP